MIAHHFTELVAWQLADRLRQDIVAFTGRAPANSDRRFCSDIRGSIESVCSNTSEGFGRFRPKEFRRGLEIARGELQETQDHLKSALDRRFVNEADFRKIWRLAVRAMAANTSLQGYLRTKGRDGPLGDTPDVGREAQTLKRQKRGNFEPKNPENLEPGEP